LDKLRIFFDNWAKESPPLSVGEFSQLTDTLKEAYLLLREFYTHPIISSILVDPGYHNALIRYDLPDERGEAYFKKTDGHWRLIDTQMTWID
jgi:hypothetical protein